MYITKYIYNYIYIDFLKKKESVMMRRILSSGTSEIESDRSQVVESPNYVLASYELEELIPLLSIYT